MTRTAPSVQVRIPLEVALPHAPSTQARRRRALLAAGVSALLMACSGPSKTPGISLGAPEITWASKSNEQRFGYMAARVHPEMQALFTEYDDLYAGNFTCETCHGRAPELVNYAMPSPDVYSLPKDNPIGATMEDDADVGNFMMGKVLPALQTAFSAGSGAPTKVNCFTCHPAED